MGTSLRPQQENDAERRWTQFIWHSEEARMKALDKENRHDDAKTKILDDELSQISACKITATR